MCLRPAIVAIPVLSSLVKGVPAGEPGAGECAPESAGESDMGEGDWESLGEGTGDGIMGEGVRGSTVMSSMNEKED